MDSSSIVSFNNDSTYQSTLKAEYNEVNVHEIALHAMRDRCLLLQRRINTLETNNMKLKLEVTKTSNKTYVPLQEDEKFLLQKKIAELHKQKSQLLHHVFMVSCENKNLWSKLSSFRALDKKENNKPLVRTNTYIHSTPKPAAKSQKGTDFSLEEISLKMINNFILEKSQLIDQYEQMVQLQDQDEDILNFDSIGFVYMEDPPTDSLKEIQNQTEKLQSLKKELAQQEKDLKTIISRVETVFTDGYKCPTCIISKAKHTYNENKETSTTDSLTQNLSSSFKNLHVTADEKHSQEEQLRSETSDKICPICGDTFSKETRFTEFQAHVENHFVGEAEVNSIDDFDTIPNSLDNLI